MYCTHCGSTLDEKVLYCSQCGTPTANVPQAQPTAPAARLKRSIYDKKIAGVCGGIAQYLNIDSTLVRIVFIVLLLLPPSAGLIAYIAGWIVMPREPERILPPAVQPDGSRVYGS